MGHAVSVLSMKGKNRKQSLARKRASKANQMRNPGAQSNYARKRAYLNANGGFGFEYVDVKPWKA